MFGYVVKIFLQYRTDERIGIPPGRGRWFRHGQRGRFRFASTDWRNLPFQTFHEVD